MRFCVQLCVCTYRRTRRHYSYVLMHMYICVYIYLHKRTCIHKYITCTLTRMHPSIYTYIYAYEYTEMTYIGACIRTGLRTHATYVHMHIYTLDFGVKLACQHCETDTASAATDVHIYIYIYI